jgi:hypothetical protein
MVTSPILICFILPPLVGGHRNGRDFSIQEAPEAAQGEHRREP